MAARHQPGGPQRHPQGARGAEGAGQLELFVAKTSGRVALTAGQSGQGGVGTPR